MITRQAPLTWEASPTMPPELLPYFVEQVAQQGGKYLIYQNEYIAVESAVRHKKLAYQYVQEASSRLSLDEAASNSGDQIMHRLEMIQATKNAGAAFRLYVRDVNVGCPIRICPAPPVFIEAHPELKKFWDEGFYDMGSQLYEDPN